jgi:hypothetical protein
MKTDYFSMLIEKLDNITNLQNAKLLSNFNKGKTKTKQVNSIEELHNYINEISDKLDLGLNDEITEQQYNEYKDNIVDIYEENKKENITIGCVNIKESSSYTVYMVILNNDNSYTNLLKNSFKDFTNSQSYFNELKSLIIKNDIDTISKKILESF